MPSRTSIPEGFEIVSHRGPFILENGPFFRLKPLNNSPANTFGFMPETRHTNSMGFMHGGMIATLLDGFIAQSLAETYLCKLVTININITFKHPIGVGRWVQSNVSLEMPVGDLVGAHATLISRNRICAEAHACFKLLR